MSKKIIAIALFAVMVLSLVPFANAATISDPVRLKSVTVGQLGTDTNLPATDKTKATIDNTGDFSKEIKITGNYDDLAKVEESKWSSVKVPKFDVLFAFETGASDVYINGAKVTRESDGTYKESFVAQRGGNLSTFKIEVKQDGATRLYDIVVRYVDDNKTAKVVRDLLIGVNRDADEAIAYNIYHQNGVVFIDYDQNWDSTTNANTAPYNKKTLNVKFDFFADQNTRIPAKDRKATVVLGTTTTHSASTVASDDLKFFTTPADNKDIPLESKSKSLTINKGVKKFSVRVEDENYFYQIKDVPVVWNAVPASEITNVTILPSRNVTIPVGETQKFEITATHVTAIGGIYLKDTSFSNIVYIDGMNVKGIKEGTTILTVYNSANKAIDAITVTVGPKAPVVTENQYRVLARKLNVRSGPGTNYPVVGSATQNQILTVVEVANGWAKLSNGTYASAQYLVQVTAATDGGAYKVTASSLNVRAAANGAKIGSLKKGTAVTVVSIADGWAQINYGGGVAYVSALYLAK